MSRKFIVLSFVMGFLSVFLIAFRTGFLTPQNAREIASPLPGYLVNNNLVQSLSFWQPKDARVLSSNVEKPEVAAKAAFVYDITSDKILYEKNADERLPIASLVKIATAIVALESKDPQTVMTVSGYAATIGENVMGISEGERYTLEELLYGLVLHSGNDAALTIAEGVAGTSSEFVAKMNQKAKILGLSDTYFVNPSGLEEDRDHEYSTARDLVALTKHALTLSLFAKVAQTYEHIIPYSADHKALFLYNQTNLLTSYPGVKGVKTGYTSSAGLCLVTYVENGGHKLIGVVLNSPSRREEMRALLDYSFTILGVKVPGRN